MRTALAVAFAAFVGGLGRAAVDAAHPLAAAAAGPAAAQAEHLLPDSVRQHLIFRVVTDRKSVAFTFDDGPDPRYTPRILEVLRRHGARATFFVTGARAEAYPHVVRLAHEQGHEIASHALTHALLTKLPRQAVRSEIQRADEIVRSITGASPRLFRPPFGAIDQTILDEALSRRYQVVMWSWTQDSRDWRNPGVDAIVRSVLGSLREGDIILMHDAGGSREQTVGALEQILARLDQRGFRYLTVSQLLREGRAWRPPSQERRPAPAASR